MRLSQWLYVVGSQLEGQRLPWSITVYFSNRNTIILPTYLLPSCFPNTADIIQISGFFAPANKRKKNKKSTKEGLSTTFERSKRNASLFFGCQPQFSFCRPRVPLFSLISICQRLDFSSNQIIKIDLPQNCFLESKCPIEDLHDQVMHVVT